MAYTFLHFTQALEADDGSTVERPCIIRTDMIVAVEPFANTKQTVIRTLGGDEQGARWTVMQPYAVVVEMLTGRPYNE